jgi:hypothetical protein
MKTILISAAAGAIIGLGFTASASAQSAQSQHAKSTPKSWNYELKGGKRVPKGNRVVAADGSWREEIRQGKCVTLKEKSAAGEYRESRRCD